MSKEIQKLDFIPKPKNSIVLEEEEYVDCLSEIIQRDFFPDLKRIKLQNELNQAIQAMDYGLAQKLNKELSEISMGNSLIQSQSNDQSNPKTNLSLDQFQNKYTSQDNDSFNQIIDKSNKEKIKNYSWFFDNDTNRMLLKDKPLDLIESNKNLQITQDSREMVTIDSWNYQSKNALIFNPDGAPLTLSDIKPNLKSISHHSTRLNSLNSTSFIPTDSNSDPTSNSSRMNTQNVWKEMASATPGLFRTDSVSPKKGQYDFVASTPSMSPHVDFDPSELMTWGTIDGTPLLLDSGTHDNGTSFKMPPTPRRDLIGLKLADQAAKNIKKRAGSSVDKVSKTNLTPRMISPAASRLLSLNKSSNGIFSGDSRLRSSYSNSGKISAKQRPTSSRSNVTSTPLVDYSDKLKSKPKVNLDDLLNI